MQSRRAAEPRAESRHCDAAHRGGGLASGMSTRVETVSGRRSCRGRPTRAGWESDLVGVDRDVLFRMATSEPLERGFKAAPGGGAGAWRAASRYVAGRSRAEALSTAADLLRRGHGVSVDLFGELV